MAQTKPNHFILILTTIILAACIISSLGIVALNVVSPQFGMTNQVCAGLATSPKWQIGISWVSPLSSYLPPLTMSPYAICIDIPDTWMRPFTTKISGGWMFPP